MKINRRTTFFIAVAFLLCFPDAYFSAPRNRITRPIDRTHRVTLRGHLHPMAIAEADQGPVEPSLTLPYVTLILKRSESQEAELDRLLAEQQDPSSPNYHHWLSPEEYADRFGVSQDDLNKVVSWLRDQSFNIAAVARGRNWVAFSGDAAQVDNAFGARIHRYMQDGEARFSNANEPSIPTALEPVVRGIHGLNNFRLRSRRRPMQPEFTSGRGNHYLAPHDVATIYNIKPLYNAGIDGTGQKLVVVGQTQIKLSDLRQFRTNFNLPAKDPQIVLVPNSRDPGIVSGDEEEADLDLEWSAAAARNADIIYVYSDDVTNSAQYAIDQNLAPVLSMSYGLCEAQTPRSDAMSLQATARQANAQGITWFAASGDSGATDCDGGNSRRTTGKVSVDLPAALPEVTGVGGTRFDEAGGSYWTATSDGNGASVLSYIQETSWNDSSPGNLSASGGGASVFFPKPTWQTGAGVPGDGARDVPDVALAASSSHDGYLIYTGGSLGVVGGTSVGAPIFAGIAALLNQYSVSNDNQPSAGLGNINPRLYQIAQTASDVFHDITTGDNIINVTCSGRSRNCTPGSFGFKAGAGYDQVTGLGSVDAYNLVTRWSGSNGAAPRFAAPMALTSSASEMTPADSAILTVTVNGANGGAPSGTVDFYLGDILLGSATLVGSDGSATGTLMLNGAALPVGADAITAQYSGDGSYSAATASITITVESGQAGQALSPNAT